MALENIFDCLDPPAAYLAYDEGDGVGAAWTNATGTSANQAREMQRTFNFLSRSAASGGHSIPYTLVIPPGNYLYANAVTFGPLVGVRVLGLGGMSVTLSSGYVNFRHNARLTWSQTFSGSPAGGTTKPQPFPWVTGRYYHYGNYVKHNSVLYRCSTSHTSQTGVKEPGVAGTDWTIEPKAWIGTTQYYPLNHWVNVSGTYYRCIVPHLPTDDNEPGVGDDWEDVWVQDDEVYLPCFTILGCDGPIFDGITWSGASNGGASGWVIGDCSEQILAIRRHGPNTVSAGTNTGAVGNGTIFEHCAMSFGRSILRVSHPDTAETNADLVQMRNVSISHWDVDAFAVCNQQSMDHKLDKVHFSIGDGWCVSCYNGGQVSLDNPFTNRIHGLARVYDGSQNCSGIVVRDWKQDDSDDRRRARWYHEADSGDLNDVTGRTRGQVIFENVRQSQGQGDVGGSLTSIADNGSGKCRLTWVCTGTDTTRTQNVANWETVRVYGSSVSAYNVLHTITAVIADGPTTPWTVTVDTDITYTSVPSPVGSWKDGDALIKLRGGGRFIIEKSLLDYDAIDYQRLCDAKPGNWLVNGNDEALACHLDVEKCQIHYAASMAAVPDVETEFLRTAEAATSPATGIEPLWFNFEGCYNDREPSGTPDDTSAPWSQSNWKVHMTLADLQQLRHRLGLDGTAVAPSGTAGAKLVDVDGVTFQNAMRVIAAMCAGRVSGAGTGSEVFKGLDESTTRVTVTADSNGNRSDIVLNL